MSCTVVIEGEHRGAPCSELRDRAPSVVMESPIPEGLERRDPENSIVRWPGTDVAVGAEPAIPPIITDSAREQSQVDLREALYNDGCTGTESRIQLPAARITRLLGIMIDLDPGKLNPNNRIFPPAADPREFLARIQGVLDHHPLARVAEVRNSGTGLHLLIWLDPPLELKTAGEQRYWDGIVRAVQATLPSDPNAPGITALTRPVGAINSKNGAYIEILRAGLRIDTTAGRRLRRATKGCTIPGRCRDSPRRAHDTLPDLLWGTIPPLGDGSRGQVLRLRDGQSGGPLRRHLLA
jgi:hypothetical protein